jgi:hypothetical protein
MQPIRRSALVLSLALLAAFGGQAVADDTKKFPTRPTIQIERETSEDLLFGKVRSKHHACEAKRKVKLRHRGIKDNAESSIVARPKTNGKGKWTFRPKRNQNGDRYVTPGYYHVKVGEKRISTGDGEIICKERESSSLFVG